jgi:hypothetical protein
MFYPDLMLTKAAALGRLEQQRCLTDSYAKALPTRVYRGRQVPFWLRRVQYCMARQLVTWGERLQAYNHPPAALAGRKSPQADRFETI